jgi:hypothetical protein
MEEFDFNSDEQLESEKLVAEIKQSSNSIIQDAILYLSSFDDDFDNLKYNKSKSFITARLDGFYITAGSTTMIRDGQEVRGVTIQVFESYYPENNLDEHRIAIANIENEDIRKLIMRKKRDHYAHLSKQFHKLTIGTKGEL